MQQIRYFGKDAGNSYNRVGDGGDELDELHGSNQFGEDKFKIDKNSQNGKVASPKETHGDVCYEGGSDQVAALDSNNMMVYEGKMIGIGTTNKKYIDNDTFIKEMIEERERLSKKYTGETIQSTANLHNFGLGILEEKNLVK